MKQWIVLVAVALAAGCTSKEERAYQQAFASCSVKLKDAAKNPSSARIPEATKRGKRERGLTLWWDRGSGLAFMNGFGALIDSSSMCSTSPDGTKVQELVIDGSAVFQDAIARSNSRMASVGTAAAPVGDAADEAAAAAAAAEAALADFEKARSK